MTSLLSAFQLRAGANVNARKASMAAEKFVSTLTSASLATILCVMNIPTVRTLLAHTNVLVKLATRAMGRIAGYLTFVDWPKIPSAMPMLSAKITSTIIRAAAKVAFPVTDSFVKTMMSAWTTVTIVMKMRSVQIFLAHSNAYVESAMNELTVHIV